MAGKGTVLLPKSDKDFSRGEFWEKFFKSRGTQSFEWYGEYSTLCGVLHKYIKPRDKLLIVGCGNSSLGADLYDTGHCRRITSIDSSAVAIRQMTQKHRKRRSGMEFIKMDATDMQDFPDAAFTCALDKATVDAVFSNDEQKETADSLLVEVGRVLSVGGRYIIVSLAQEHILRLMCDVFTREGTSWLIRVLVAPQAPDSDLHLPVFAFVFTKCVVNSRLPRVIEVENPGAEKLTRLDNVDQLVAWVAALQEAAMLSQSVNADQEGRVTFENELGKTTYTCFLLQRRRPSKQPFAVFVVPFGKHTSSSFCGAAARRDVVEAVATQRLLMVFLHPDVFYDSHDAVKASLSRVVMRYAPRSVDMPLKESEVQFLSCGDIYPSRSVVERCVGAGDGAGEVGVRLLVEEVTGWGRRVLLPDCPDRLPVSGVASDRVAAHVRAWLSGAGVEGRILTAGATPVFPGSLGPDAELSCCLFVPPDVRLPMGEALRDHVLPESLKSVRLLPDLDACGTFEVVVWRGGETPDSLLHLCPGGLLVVVGPVSDSQPSPALSYDVVEPGLDTRTRLAVWTDDPESLFRRVAAQTADEEDEEMVAVLREIRVQVERK